MPAKVNLLPSGHEFLVEPQETVLEAALRAGLAPTYNCSNGTCGECKARLVSGQLSDCRFHDYIFKATDKAVGMFLMCSAHAATDLVIEAKEAGGAHDIPLQHVKTQVQKLERPHPDFMVVHLRTPRTHTLRFLAGQHVKLEIPGLAPRHKSIASCPCNAMHLQFHFRRTTDDPFSEHVFTKLGTGQTVIINGPYGNFTLNEHANRPVIFLAYETGISPIKSLIEHAIALEFSRDMHLYWVASRSGYHYIDNLCRSWMDAFDNFTYTALTGNNKSLDDGKRTLDQDFLHGAARIVENHSNLNDFNVYVNGPETAMLVTRKFLLEHGLPEAQLFVDYLPRT